ncbi:MAG: exodeoxyribonuclease III [Clostridia bacterium]|nr:exodeoxyribonuclease III [Clostridia bacterium]
MKKLISWNVNGFRAVLEKGFADFFRAEDADIFSIQETKMQPGQADFEHPGYFAYYSSAVKKGYSGTAVFAKEEPDNVLYGIGADEKYSDEGRLITLEYPAFYLVNSYTPNAQRELTRLDYRMVFEDDLRGYLSDLSGKKPVILCGDLNVAHNEIDLKNPKTNVGNAGFTNEERGKMTELLSAGFTDTFRYLYPDRTGAYSWWSYMFKSRERNTGWRIDYFIVSDRLRDSLRDAVIYADVMGSDHCPVGLMLDI